MGKRWSEGEIHAAGRYGRQRELDVQRGKMEGQRGEKKVERQNRKEENRKSKEIKKRRGIERKY